MTRSCLVLSLLSLSLVACSHGAALRKSFARSHNCPSNTVSQTPYGTGYLLQGCGAREICDSARGPCRPDLEELMVRARATWAMARGCSEADIQVSPGAEGIAVSGCGAYGICPGSATNCFASQPPSCQDFARQRFDQCTRAARGTGYSGRDPVYYPNNVGTAATDIARNVTASVSENRQADACQSTYQFELSRCQ